MAIRKNWTIKEIEVNGNIAQRQTMMEISEDENDHSWHWIRPDDRLNEIEKEEWDRIMSLLSNVNGEDLRHIICGSRLMDHCFNKENPSKYC